MSLAPLLNAEPVIQVHAFAAIAALALGIVQLSAPKGTLPHRSMGWIWVTLMLIVSISAFFIHQIRMWGPWSPIHLLAVYTLIMLPVGVIAAHRHVIERHRRTMAGIFIGGLVIAGVFTFYPGRIMYHVVFGGN
ncbi:MAG TPA: DUF2306 domain-containing protein [Xanthobacteraceae bacterium]|nr:DUF2306 domain-containing protein [Xanthobacteraceae bacterium]